MRNWQIISSLASGLMLVAAQIATAQSTAQAATAGLPDTYQGVCVSGSCATTDDGSAWALTRYQEIYVEDDLVAMGPLVILDVTDNWVRLANKVDPSFTFFVRPAENPTGIDVLALKDGVPPGITPATDNSNFDITSYRRCNSFPTAEQALYGESLVVMRALDPAITTCSRQSGACVRAVFDAFDLYSDGMLSRAEMAHALRYLFQVAASNGDDGDNSTIVFGATALSILTAPVLAHLLLVNLDYDMSGALNLEELVSGRIGDDLIVADATQGIAMVRTLGRIAEQAAAAAKKTFHCHER